MRCSVAATRNHVVIVTAHHADGYYTAYAYILMRSWTFDAYGYVALILQGCAQAGYLRAGGIQDTSCL